MCEYVIVWSRSFSMRRIQFSWSSLRFFETLGTARSETMAADLRRTRASSACGTRRRDESAPTQHHEDTTSYLKIVDDDAYFARPPLLRDEQLDRARSDDNFNVRVLKNIVSLHRSLQ